MTPTLMDVVMITGLDISSSSPSAFELAIVPFKLSSKTDCSNWGSYMKEHAKTYGFLEYVVGTLRFLWPLLGSD